MVITEATGVPEKNYGYSLLQLVHPSTSSLLMGEIVQFIQRPSGAELSKTSESHLLDPRGPLGSPMAQGFSPQAGRATREGRTSF